MILVIYNLAQYILEIVDTSFSMESILIQLYVKVIYIVELSLQKQCICWSSLSYKEIVLLASANPHKVKLSWKAGRYFVR